MRGMGHSQELIDAVYAERGRLSGSQIGAMVGMSRNAVCGIWDRERMRRGDPPLRGSGPRTTPEEKEEAHQRRLAAKCLRWQAERVKYLESCQHAQSKSPVVPGPKPPVMPSDGSSGVAFFDLQPDSCRYPLGGPTEPARWFCGEWCLPGKSYCEGHQRVCYQRRVPWYERRATA